MWIKFSVEKYRFRNKNYKNVFIYLFILHFIYINIILYLLTGGQCSIRFKIKNIVLQVCRSSRYDLKL